MRYLLLVHVQEPLGGNMTEEEGAAMRKAGVAWAEEMDARGVRLMGQRLRPAEEARVVRERGGKLSVTDGPFAETKDQIAGFDVLECGSLEEAVKAASKHPVARFGSLEVRAFWGA
jgi:hypothetical protein